MVESNITAKYGGRCDRQDIEMNFRLIAGALSILFFVIVGLLIFSGVIQQYDAQVAILINHSTPIATFTTIMVIFSNYGREYFWIPVVALMLLLGNRNTKLLAFELAGLFLAGIVFGEILKVLVYRPRPFVTLDNIILRVPTDTDSSFPSGHALIVAVGAAFTYFKFKNKATSLIFIIEAALVCYSRVYVGAHYPTDVISGIFLGVGIASIGIFILEKYVMRLLEKLTSLAEKVFRNGPLSL
jgi:membrane-associated phospholipid phosphatase